MSPYDCGRYQTENALSGENGCSTGRAVDALLIVQIEQPPRGGRWKRIKTANVLCATQKGEGLMGLFWISAIVASAMVSLFSVALCLACVRVSHYCDELEREQNKHK